MYYMMYARARPPPALARRGARVTANESPLASDRLSDSQKIFTTPVRDPSHHAAHVPTEAVVTRALFWERRRPAACSPILMGHRRMLNKKRFPYKRGRVGHRLHTDGQGKPIRYVPPRARKAVRYGRQRPSRDDGSPRHPPAQSWGGGLRDRTDCDDTNGMRRLTKSSGSEVTRVSATPRGVRGGRDPGPLNMQRQRRFNINTPASDTPGRQSDVIRWTSTAGREAVDPPRPSGQRND
ncbi:hypothetical protein EVAR_88623_1 [Eumeta japonica]|uniref:Uncharacterized protein n=1 Tax=Eumeta variegata TaxID=151549 RepID=A0A4C1X3R6_EUMVA|nr:hypothetical protein EVAR_88623_1 [Eumeta japonica]